MKKKKSYTLQGHISQLLDVSLDMVADVPRMILTNNSELTVENYKSIEEYSPEEICLKCTNFRIVVTGQNLTVLTITDEEIYIKGIIGQVAMK